MKKILFLMLLIPRFISAQYTVNNLSTHTSRMSVENTLSLPSGCGTPSGVTTLRGGYTNRPAAYFDTCGKTLWIWSPQGASWKPLSTADSTIWATAYKVKNDSILMKGFINALIADSVYQAAQLNLRMKYTDTASMLNAYPRLTRFLDSLADVQARLNLKADKSITVTAQAPLTGGGDLSANRTLGADTGRGTSQLVTGGSLNKVRDSLQANINGKEPTLTAGTTGQYYRGDKSWQTLDKTAVGLGNVPNTDATNPANISQTSSYRFVTDAEKSTWNGKQNALGFTPENVANKATDFTTVNNTLYPTTSAVNSFVQASLTSVVKDRGSYDASGNVFPSTGGSGTGGAVMKGDMWTVSVAGTLGSKVVAIGDWIRALTDVPGQTSANWAITDGKFGYVPENQANKSDNTSLGTSTTLYPTQNAVKTYVDNRPALTFGTHLTGSSYNGSTAVTLGTDATNANTASTIVSRDANGAFSAGAISANSGTTSWMLTVGSSSGSPITGSPGSYYNPNILMYNSTGSLTGQLGLRSDGSFGFYDNGAVLRTSIAQSGALTLGSIPAGSGGNNILVNNGGIVSYRTPSQILTDIGALSTSSASSTYVPQSGYAFGTAFSLGTMFVSTGEQVVPSYLLGVYSNGYTYKYSPANLKSSLGYYTSGDNVSLGSVTASSFSGAGTGLTGTASSLTVGNSTLWNGTVNNFAVTQSSGINSIIGFDGTSTARAFTSGAVNSFIGLTTSNWVDLASAQTILAPKTIKYTGEAFILQQVNSTDAVYQRWKTNTGSNMLYMGFAVPSSNDFYISNQIAGAIHLRTNDVDRYVINSSGDEFRNGINNATSHNTSYFQSEFGGISILYHNALDAYINSNHTFNSSDQNVASYTSANGIGRLEFIGGFLRWHTYNGSVTAGTAYGLTNALTIDPAGNTTITGNVDASAYKLGGVNSLTFSGTTVYVANNSYWQGINLITNGTTALTINGSQQATFANTVTASSFIKSGGTSSQYLMADGSVRTSPVSGATRSASTSLSVSATSDVYTFTGSSNATWTLPDAAANAGRKIYFFHNGGATTHLEIATFDASNQITNNGTTNYAAVTIVASGGYAMLVSDGVYWQMLIFNCVC